MMHLNIRLSFPLLLLGLASFSSSETCPESENLYPCVCEKNGNTGEITVKCSPNEQKINLEKLRESLTSLSGKRIRELVIDQCSWSSPVVTIPSKFFYGLDIKQLSIESCEIYGLGNNFQPPLLGLENHLEKLQIKQSYVAKTDKIDLNFEHMRKLKNLYLSGNRIIELGNDWLENGPMSLEILTLKDNDLEKVGDRLFENLVNLRELYINDDVLGSIERLMFPFPAATRLETLSLKNTGLTSLPDDIFSKMPALRNIDLSTNGILRLDLWTWEPVWEQLSIVELAENPIKCDKSMKWIFTMVTKHPAVYGKCQDRRDLGGKNMDISFYIRNKTQE